MRLLVAPGSLLLVAPSSHLLVHPDTVDVRFFDGGLTVNDRDGTSGQTYHEGSVS